jgi:hypothetical protein
MTKERLRRTDPPRTDPIRDWEQLFRRPDPTASDVNGAGNGADAQQQNGANGHAWDDAVTHAVKLGYRIVEDQIDQGKRVAEQLSERSYTSNSVGGDVSEFLRRLLQFYTDMGASCFEFIDSLTRSSEFTDNVRDWVDEGLSGTAAADAGDAGRQHAHRQIAIDIQSDRPARVSLDVSDAGPAGQLGIHGLHGLEASNPPLTDIEFVYEDDASEPVLRIRVPDGQPADTYTGVVVDTSTNQPRGTLSVRIRHEVAGTS